MQKGLPGPAAFPFLGGEMAQTGFQAKGTPIYIIVIIYFNITFDSPTLLSLLNNIFSLFHANFFIFQITDPKRVGVGDLA